VQPQIVTEVDMIILLLLLWWQWWLSIDVLRTVRYWRLLHRILV